MANTPLTPEVATARHADQASAICKVLGAEPGDITWSYDWAMRIDGTERDQALKGIEVFTHNPEPYLISLMGKVGRKRQQEKLDSRAMAQDPAQWPLEMFQTPKPEGVSIWLWQPRRSSSPGWNEAVVLSSVKHPKSGAIEIQAQSDDNQVHTFAREDGQWEALVGPEATKSWKKVPAQEIVDTLDHGCMVAGEVSIAALLAELGADPAMAPEGSEEDAPPAPGTGRRWNWGQSIPEQDIAVYTQLIKSKEGVSSGNFMDVIAGISNPANQIKDQVAQAVLEAIARGQDGIDAARAAIEAHPALPALPDGETDIAGFIDANAKAAPPVPVRPVFLGGR